MQYLECPIYLGKYKITYFNNMVAKVSNRMQGWQGKLLSHGGKSVLIKLVLHFIPLHVLLILYPPKTVLSKIEKVIAYFFWGKEDKENKVHWKSWSDLWFPTQKGGAGFRSLNDFCKVFAAKSLWNFRTRRSLLKDFIEAKYRKRKHHVYRNWSYEKSHTWKRLVNIMEHVKKFIL